MKDETQKQAVFSPGKGYRFLKRGELIKKGDEFICFDGWKRVSVSIGDVANATKFRRKLPEKPSPERVSGRIVQLLFAPNDATWQGVLLGLSDNGETFVCDDKGLWKPYIPPLGWVVDEAEKVETVDGSVEREIP